jgi:hypothetical protein
MRLLSIARRALTLLEFIVRRNLVQVCAEGFAEAIEGFQHCFGKIEVPESLDNY